MNSSENATDVTTARKLQSKEEIASQAHWIISVVASLIIIFTNLWIAIAFYHHVFTTKVLKKKKSRRDVNGGFVMIMALASVVAPFIRYFGTLFLLFVSLFQEFTHGCEIANDICVVGFGIAILPSYAFLWVRQRAFYAHPSLRHTLGRCVSVFSHICIVLIVLMATVSVGSGVFPYEYTPQEGGCTLEGGEEKYPFRTYIYAGIMIASQFVLLGLFIHPLRIHAQQQKELELTKSTRSDTTEVSSTDGPSSSADYSTSRSTDYRTSTQCINGSVHAPSPKPTRTKRSQSVPVNNRIEQISKEFEPRRKGSVIAQPEPGEMKKARSATVYTDNSSRTRPSTFAIKAITTIRMKVRRTTMRSRRIFKIIRRVLYLAVISVCFDLVIMAINAFAIPNNIPQTYGFVMYDLSLLTSVIIVVLSFENWRDMMLSPITSLKKKIGQTNV